MDTTDHRNPRGNSRFRGPWILRLATLSLFVLIPTSCGSLLGIRTSGGTSNPLVTIPSTITFQVPEIVVSVDWSRGSVFGTIDLLPAALFGFALAILAIVLYSRKTTNSPQNKTARSTLSDATESTRT